MDSENQKNSEDAAVSEPRNFELSQIDFLRGLADIAREENLTELEVEQNGIRVTLRASNSDEYSFPAAPQGFYPVAGTPQLAPAFAPASPAPSTPAAAAAPEENLLEIVSPMVGVFYRAPSPADPNFIEIGDKVEVGQTVALVEAMKVFNEIVAEVSGVVVEIKPAGADLVETGQTIITLRAI